MKKKLRVIIILILTVAIVVICFCSFVSQDIDKTYKVYIVVSGNVLEETDLKLHLSGNVLTRIFFYKGTITLHGIVSHLSSNSAQSGSSQDIGYISMDTDEPINEGVHLVADVVMISKDFKIIYGYTKELREKERYVLFKSKLDLKTPLDFSLKAN